MEEKERIILEENVSLIESKENKNEKEKEKESLIEILNKIEYDLKKNENKDKSIIEIYRKYVNNNYINKEIKRDINICKLKFMIIFFSTFFVIINLIGIFQLITLMNTLSEFIKTCILTYFTLDENNLDDVKKAELVQKYNFYEIFLEKSKNNEIDFNLMMFTNIFGEMILNSTGFRFSSSISMFINCIPFFLIVNFNFDSYEENYKYNIYKIIYLIICYIFLFFGVGSSSLLSQKILIDSYLKYKNYKISLDKKKLKKEIKKQKRQKRREKKKEEIKTNIIKKIEKEFEMGEIKKEKENDTDKDKDKEKENITKNENNKNTILNCPKKEKIFFSRSFMKKTVEFEISKKENEDLNQIIEKDKNDKKENLIEKEINNEDIKLNSINEILLEDSTSEFQIQKRTSKTFVSKKNKVELKRSNDIIVKMEEDLKYNENNKFDSFLLVSISIVLGFFGKYILNIILDKYLQNNNKYNNVNEFISKKIFFNYIFIIYISSIVISIILYSIFSCCVFIIKKKKVKEENSYRICNFCGYILYTQDIATQNRSKECCCWEHLKLCEETFQYCCNRTIANALFCSDKKTYDDECCFCCKCCCGCEHNEEHYEKKNEFFCYCYQAERKHRWMEKFITNEAIGKITPFLFGYYLSQTTIIGFNNLYENKENIKNKENKENKEYNEKNSYRFLFIFVGSLSLFFYLTYSVGRYNYFFNKNNGNTDNENKDNKNKNNKIKYNTNKDEKNGYKNKDKKKDNRNKENETISEISNVILAGILSIIIFNSIFSIILSYNLLNENDKSDNFWVKNEFILIPILLNKLYYCTLMHYCLEIYEKNKEYFLISTSTLVSIYLYLWNKIYNLIKGYLNINALYIIQIIFSGVVLFPFILIAIFFIIHSIISGYCFYLFFIFLSYFLCGHIWFFKLYDYLDKNNFKLRFCGICNLNPDKFIYCSCGKLGSYCDSNNKFYCQCCFYYGYEENCCDCTECCDYTISCKCCCRCCKYK